MGGWGGGVGGGGGGGEQWQFKNHFDGLLPRPFSPRPLSLAVLKKQNSEHVLRQH